jgi:hypothetical protein
MVASGWALGGCRVRARMYPQWGTRVLYGVGWDGKVPSLFFVFFFWPPCAKSALEARGLLNDTPSEVARRSGTSISGSSGFSASPSCRDDDDDDD